MSGYRRYYKSTASRRSRGNAGYKSSAARSSTVQALRASRPMMKSTSLKGYARTGGYYGRYAPVNPGSMELKFHDVDLDDAVIAAGANVTASINLIAQGVTESTRVGRKCTIKAINWRYSVTLPSINAGTGTAEGDTVRVILYLDKQANGATAANTDVLESADYQSFNNLANKGRFKIMHDKTYSLNYAALGSDGTTMDAAAVRCDDAFYKKMSIPIEFDSTTGAITEIRSNNFGVLLCSANGVAGFASKFRLRFSDQ